MELRSDLENLKAISDDTLTPIMRGNDKVLVFFWASWCNPCKQLWPYYEKAAEENPDVTFGTIDVQAQEKIAVDANVMATPTLMAFKNGKVVFRQSGAIPPAMLTQLIAELHEG